MKILITGAGGMLGTDLARRLALKHSLIGAGRKPAPHLEIPFRVGDLVQFKTAQELISAEKPEIVLHAAAMTDVDRCETNRREALQGNLEVTRNVTEAANQAGAFLIFFSTDFVFDGTKAGPYQEEDMPHPINVYGETKLLAERYVLLRSRHALILRTSWTFGKQGDNFPRKVLRQAEEGKTLQVVSDQSGNPTYTGDLAEAVGKIIESVRKQQAQGTQIYHIANEGAVSRYEYARSILKKRNYPLDLILPLEGEKAHIRPARRPQNSALSTKKVKSHFGVQLRPWEEALEAYLEEDDTLPSAKVLKR